MVKVENITKTFGNYKAVDNLSFELNKGDVTGLLGPNGAGKTTTMRIITSYYFPNSGKITIEGLDTQEKTLDTQKLIGYLPENNPLYFDMIVYDFLMMTAKLNGVKTTKAKEKIVETAKKLDITKKLLSPIGDLSKGFRQRVGLASTLLHDPHLIILDEPTEGLDPVQREEIRKLIKELSKDRAILLSTHVLQEVKAMCNKVIVINQGKLVTSGSPDNLSAKKGLIVKIEGHDIQNVLRKNLKKEDDIKELSSDGDIKTFQIHSKDELRTLLSKLSADNKWTIWEMQVEDNLEEVFKNLG